MNNKEIINKIVKLQILTIRYVERNTNLKCNTHRDMERVIMGNKLTCTYKEAVDNLYSNIKQFCKENDYLMEEVLILKEEVENSSIKELRFGREPQKRFLDEENLLDSYMLKRTFFMINEMVGIKDAAEMLDLTESAIKQACQQERLLNTRKVGKSWMVHIPECRSYWNKPDTNEEHLYSNWIY